MNLCLNYIFGHTLNLTYFKIMFDKAFHTWTIPVFLINCVSLTACHFTLLKFLLLSWFLLSLICKFLLLSLSLNIGVPQKPNPGHSFSDSVRFLYRISSNLLNYYLHTDVFMIYNFRPNFAFINLTAYFCLLRVS